MFSTETYQARRKALRGAISDGVIVIPGHRMVPRNYPDNTYPFRQNSHFLYYCGIDRADCVLVMRPDGDELFGPPEDLDDVVWHGPHDTLEDESKRAGIAKVSDIGALKGELEKVKQHGFHYLAPYHRHVLKWVADLLGLAADEVAAGGSRTLANAICDQRSVKTDDEIAQIEDALGVTRAMHLASMKATRPGIRESEVVAAVMAVSTAADRAQAYNPIVTVRGEVLHNHAHHHMLEDGQLLLNDSGAESPEYYASDITRTVPVNGKFSDEQRGIYETVLQAQLASIEVCQAGTLYRDVHLESARTISKGLCELGIMKGDPEEATAKGAHALFFPHGVGHMLGLDVHDMEDLGDIVGYPEGEERSDQFGLNFLRLAKPLKAGYVVTVEPGVYFIPALIDRWRKENRLADYINYDRVEQLKGFGGIRIEDDVLCTSNGAKVLGPAIPKTVEEVEAAVGA